MKFTRPLVVLVLALVALSSCSRDPNVLKQTYLNSGNKWFDRGKYREAILMYKDAIQKDKKFAEAHYRLGLTYLKMVPANVNEGVRSLRRADEFFKNDPHYKDNPHYWDTVIRLSQIYLNVAPNDKGLQEEVTKNAKALLAHDPNSFDGHNLTGELADIHGMLEMKQGLKDESKVDFDTALAEYKKAAAVKPNDLGLLMNIGAVYRAQGDFKSSEESYQKILGIDKTYLSAYLSLYSLAFEEKNMTLAEQVLKDGYKNNPKQFGFLERLALFYWWQKRNDDMLAALKEIKDHSAENPNAYFDVGDFYYRLRDGDGAIREYRLGIEKDPKHHIDYLKHIIEVLMSQNKTTEAASLNQQILDQNPNDSYAKNLEASFKLSKGDVAHALAELQQVVTQSPDNALARFNLGRAYAMQGAYAEARQHFDKAIELRPDYLQARIALAQLEVIHGEYEAGAKAAEAALGVDPNSLAARLVETAAMIGMKKYQEARTMLDAVLVGNPNNPDVIFQLAVVDMSENKYKDAEVKYRKVYDLNPDNPRALVGMAETYISQGKIDEALKLLKEESEKRPSRLDLQMVVADTAQRTGRFQMSLDYYQHVLDSLDKASKQRAEILTRMGEVYRRKGDMQHAIESLNHAKDMQPTSLGILVELGLTLDEAKQWAQAQKVYEAALKINPNEPFSLNNLAFLEAEHGGDLNQAQTLAQRAKQFWPDRPEVADTLGWIYLKRNLAQNAVDIFKELVRTNPRSSTFQYHLCQAYDKLGDKVSARTACTQAMRENPPADEMNEIRGKLQQMGQ